MAVHIKDVQPGSPAALAGLKSGMELISLDGHEIRDGLDYEFYSPPARLNVVARDGEQTLHITVQKEEYKPLGCIFGSYLIDDQHSCKNKCVFCFIDQLPKGLRSSLYFKDDDERLGFLFGNYITLTNLTELEIDRIIEQRIAPVNISVHTTDPTLRVQMMANPRAGEVLTYIHRLAQAGIPLNFQLVLCPGLNDGEELIKSLDWLAGLGPAVQSIAAVPVGLTRYREGLYPLESYTSETAAAQLDILLAAGEKHLAQRGTRLVYPSDEWFLLAGQPIPPEAFYEGYPQLENGVGMWRFLENEFLEALADTEEHKGPRQADIAVGKLAAPLFESLSRRLADRFPDVHLYVHGVENLFFGPKITVTGLLTGQDIIEQLYGQLHSQRLFLPYMILRHEGDLLLDGTSPADIEAALDTKVIISEPGGDKLLEAILTD